MENPSFMVQSLGPAKFKSPVQTASPSMFVSDQKRLAHRPHTDDIAAAIAAGGPIPSFEVAGPRAKVFFDPQTVKAAIVTCGGLCPGLNAVIRGLVMQLWHRYGCKDIIGIPFGYQGLGGTGGEPVALTPHDVTHIHTRGGTILGSSRGTPSTEEIVDRLQKLGINMLFTIGGDGTMWGANAIQAEASKRGYELSVVGIPKTIDNDIPFVRRSFGFETAMSLAGDAVHAAHIEAQGAPNGLGVVKLMGRHSGYIAASACLATGHANFCLVPEIDFSLEGPNGLFELVEKRLAERNHCVIVLAEGCGQFYFDADDSLKDASGNQKLINIGRFIRDRLGKHFATRPGDSSIKYIDPSYMIRAAAANPADQIFCNHLAQCAVHAAMAGKTGVLIGYWHGQMTHIPITALEGKSQRINPTGEMWFNVLETTGQPNHIGRIEDVVKEPVASVYLN